MLTWFSGQETMKAIELRNLGKRYIMRRFRRYLFRDIINKALFRSTEPDEFWALRDLNVSVETGESVGIIGENGAGKTTLLKLLSNVTQPTEGEIIIRGRTAALLELGAGFHPLLTGRENIYLNGTILGFDKKYIDGKFDEIVDFSGISKFIDEPVKNYSSGMYVRLGFAIASQLDPAILIVDEVLAVGDEEFQRHCKEWIYQYLKSGRTLLLVSHDLGLIRDLCKRVYWLRNGLIHQEGSIEEITTNYLMYVGRKFGLTTLSRGPLSIIFEKGKLIIFYNGIELTKNLCGHTYLMSSASWQTSTDAHWEILDSSEDYLKAHGSWKLLPVKQTWEVIVESEKSIRWNIEMKVAHDVMIKNDTVNLMISDKYRQWFTPDEQGDYPPEFDEKFGTRIIGIGMEHGLIGVKEVKLANLKLPSVSFQILKDKNDFLTQATNTDKQLSSRTLQYSRIKNDSQYLAGETYRFEGLIRIDQKNDTT